VIRRHEQESSFSSSHTIQCIQQSRERDQIQVIAGSLVLFRSSLGFFTESSVNILRSKSCGQLQ
jgi:hypothetical protein